MLLSIVVAVDNNFAIGKAGNLLWHLPNDMKRFKEITYGHHVVMGRKTFESIPPKFRPLSGRVNIVISRTLQFEGCKNVNTIEQAIAFAKENGEKELMIIGGGEIYRQTLALAHKIYLTQVHHSFNADTYFPRIHQVDWKIDNINQFETDEKHQFAYTFSEWLRK